jgi:hypothetical protein
MRGTSTNLRSQIVSILIIFAIAFFLVFFSTQTAIALEDNSSTMGVWETVPLASKGDRIQSVHTIVLPNGKVLMVNGSSFRSTLEQENGKYKFIEGVDLTKYDVVNNSGLLDPVTGKFERIPSPPAMVYDDELQHKTTNDLFCSGHLQLANGDVLFVSGTGRYYPGGAFTGSKWLNIYHWQTNKWENVGQMHDGRWYPTLVSLSDGKIAIFSGLKFGEPNQINPSLEVYNPETNELKYLDLREVKNSPFNTKVEKENVYDSIDLYPRIFPLADGRLLITGDEAGIAGVLVPHFSTNSYLMSIDTDESGELLVSFERGDARHETTKAYGTALQVPNSEDVLLFGGIIGTNSISFGREGKTDSFPKEVRVATSLQRWNSPTHSGTKNGKWEIFTNFLPQPRANLQAVILPNREILVINGGQYPEYQPIYEPLLLTPDNKAKAGYQTTSMSPAKFPRLYHNGAVLLPDGRVLVVGGNANRAAVTKDGTIHVDILGDPKSFFRPQMRNKSGEIEQFELDTYYKDPQHYYADGDSEPFVPAEIWQGEIFSPPYLFKPGERPEIVSVPDVIEYGQTGVIAIKGATEKSSLVLNKLGSVTHSIDNGQRLIELPSKLVDNSSLRFTAPTNANLYPPGYYMMFYLNDIGKPSHAKIIRLTINN